MKTIRYQLQCLNRITFCSFIPQCEAIETCHYPEYVARLQKQATNLDEKKYNEFCKKTAEADKAIIYSVKKISYNQLRVFGKQLLRLFTSET